MTKKRCTDCKHTKGIGFDFWCGEGHTKYESLGETNCPYFEYHDWSKGIPSKTEKRFTKEEMIYLGNGYITIGSGTDKEKIPIEDISVRGSDIRNLDDEQICDLLNNLAKENKQLEEENEELNEELMEYDSFKRLYEEKIEKLKKKNEQLKLKNELLERDLYYCAKQFKEDVENILLDLKGGFK